MPCRHSNDWLRSFFRPFLQLIQPTNAAAVRVAKGYFGATKASMVSASDTSEGSPGGPFVHDEGVVHRVHGDPFLYIGLNNGCAQCGASRPWVPILCRHGYNRAFL